MLFGRFSDANLYEAVHHLLQRTRRGGRERRHAPRHEAAFWLLVAPLERDHLPAAAAFVPAQCLDLSQGGLCLRLQRRPQAPYLLVALGKQPAALMVTEVVSTTELFHAGQTSYRVGCRFLRRVDVWAAGGGLVGHRAAGRGPVGRLGD